jgi:hypothetical protein
MKDNIYHIFDISLKGGDDSDYQESSWKLHYFYKSHVPYVILTAMSIVSFFLISNILVLQPEIMLVFASSGQDEDDDNNEEEEENNTGTSSLGDTESEIDDTNSFLSYNNSEYGIRMNYPSDWSYQDVQPPTNTAVIPIVNMFPPISEDPNAVTFLEIGIENLENPFSINEYSRSVINGYRESRLNFNLVSSNTDSTLSGLPAYEIVFTDSANGTERKFMEVGAIDSSTNRVYYLFFNTEESRYDLFVPTLESMIESFRLAHVSGESLIRSSNDVTNNDISNDTMEAESTTAPATTLPSLSVSQNDTANSSSNIQSNDMLVYENSTYGVSLLYPATWNHSDPIKSPEERTVFITVFEPAAESGVAHLGIARDVFNVNETLDTYLAEVIQSYRGNTLNFTLISTDMSPDLISPPQLAGNPAYSLLYSHIDPITGDMLLTEEIGTIVPGTNFAYYFYYTADIPSYNRYIDDALSIIDSLEIHLTNLNITESEETNIIDILESLESGEI